MSSNHLEARPLPTQGQSLAPSNTVLAEDVHTHDLTEAQVLLHRLDPSVKNQQSTIANDASSHKPSSISQSPLQASPSTTISNTEGDRPNTPVTSKTSDRPVYYTPENDRSSSAPPVDPTTVTIETIIDKMKKAFKLKGHKKPASNTQASILLREIIDSLWSLPTLIQQETSSTNAALTTTTNDFEALNNEYATLQRKYEVLHEHYKDLTHRYADLRNTHTDLQQKTSGRQTDSSSILQEVDARLAFGLAKMENSLKSMIQNSLGMAIPSSPNTTIQQRSSMAIPGTIIISPTEPLNNENKDSYVAALKTNMLSSKINPQLIKDTRETRSGAIIVNCHNVEDANKVESALRQNTKINRMANIRNAGPKFIRLIIKNIPHQIQENILTDSLAKLLGPENFKLQRFFVYKNGLSYSQVVAIREDLALPLLAEHSPKIQIGNCYYAADIYIPTIRCFKCQDLGHTYDKCRQTKAFCATCGRSGHTTAECNVDHKDKQKHNCINCHMFNARLGHGDNTPRLPTNHMASSSLCPRFKTYFNTAYDQVLKNLLPQKQPTPTRT